MSGIRKNRDRPRRCGAAVVEMAICLPVIFLIVIGTIESANALFLRQALVQSAYESAKVAIHRDGTNGAAIQAAKQVAAGRRINQIEIRFSPSNVASVLRGNPLTVTVSAPGSANSLFRFPPFNSQTVSTQAVMVKE